MHLSMDAKELHWAYGPKKEEVRLKTYLARAMTKHQHQTSGCRIGLFDSIFSSDNKSP